MPEMVVPTARRALSPAAIPATWVAWSENFGSNGLLAYCHFGDRGANARATITFPVVYARLPFGKLGGGVKPAAPKNGCDWSTPSSMIPILMPFPAVDREGPHNVGAPMSAGVWLRSVCVLPSEW